MNNELKKMLFHVNKLKLWQTLSVCEQLVILLINVLCAKLLSDLVMFSTNGDVSNALKIAGIIGFILCLRALGSYLFTLRYNSYASTARHNIEMNTYTLIENVTSNETEQKKGGSFFETINDDLNTIADHATKTIPQVAGSIICALGYLVFLFLGNYIIALTIFVMALIQIIPPMIVKKYIEKNYDDTRDIEAELTDEIISGYRGFEIIKLYRAVKWEIGRIAKLHSRYVKIGSKGTLSLRFEDSMTEFFRYIMRIGTYIAIGLFYMNNICSLEAGISALAISTSFFASTQVLFRFIPEIGVADKALERNNWLLNSEQHHKSDTDLRNRAVNLCNVSYSDGVTNIINKANARIDLEANTIILGKNGSGKTTMLELIQGIRSPTSGVIDYEGFSQDMCRYCHQDNLNLNMTTQDLYALFDEEIQNNALVNAESLGITSKDFEKRIRDLSGGEKRKVFLALTLAHNGYPVFLDEPTNHIDDESVTKLLQMMKKHQGGLVVASHDNRVKDVAVHTLEVKDGTITNE